MTRPELPPRPDDPAPPQSGSGRSGRRGAEDDGGRARKTGRIARLLDDARALRRDPRSAIVPARELLVAVWRRRGGGFYGLGYIVAFVVLWVQMLVGDLADSASASEFLLAQLLEWLFRLGFLSFLVALQALLWPIYVLETLGGIGIIALVVGYFGFEHLVRPAVERMLPELREDRELREERGRRKRKSKAAPRQTENGNPSSSEHNP